MPPGANGVYPLPSERSRKEFDPSTRPAVIFFLIVPVAGHDSPSAAAAPPAAATRSARWSLAPVEERLGKSWRSLGRCGWRRFRGEGAADRRRPSTRCGSRGAGREPQRRPRSPGRSRPAPPRPALSSSVSAPPPRSAPPQPPRELRQPCERELRPPSREGAPAAAGNPTMPELDPRRPSSNLPCCRSIWAASSREQRRAWDTQNELRETAEESSGSRKQCVACMASSSAWLAPSGGGEQQQRSGRVVMRMSGAAAV
ncbi:unnamed protein product [Urochloa humidicola]